MAATAPYLEDAPITLLRASHPHPTQSLHMRELQEFQKEFWIQTCSTPDSKYLMAEVWYRDFLIATVDRENGSLAVSFAGGRQANHEYEYVSVNFDKLLETLEKAKQALTS